MSARWERGLWFGERFDTGDHVVHRAGAAKARLGKNGSHCGAQREDQSDVPPREVHPSIEDWKNLFHN